MALFEELRWRGLVHQVTHPELEALLAAERVTLYCGFDPTATSLHIGGLLPVIALRHFQLAGHRPIVLVGGATGMIGDPSGKSEERQLQGADQIAANVAGIRAQLARFLDFDGPNGAVLVNNHDWTAPMTLIAFLRDIGKHFSVNAMLQRDSVRQRLADRDQGISYTEFSYMLLQAHDFLHLYDAHGCRLQIGGSDQWGNIVSGMDLTRRLRDGAQTFGMTLPLLTRADGQKFGKSESGNVWLDPARTSPYKMYQFLLNQADADTPKLLRFLTFLPRAEIEALEAALAAAPERREAQRRLAEEVVRFVHGDAALANAEAATRAMFGGPLDGLDEATLEDIFAEMPRSEVPLAALDGSRSVIDLLADPGVGVFQSKGEGRKLIQNGGLYLNNERVADANAPVTRECLTAGAISVVRKGKKQYHLLRFV